MQCPRNEAQKAQAGVYCDAVNSFTELFLGAWAVTATSCTPYGLWHFPPAWWLQMRSAVPKGPGLFAPKLLLAAVRVSKGAIRGPLLRKKPQSQLSTLALWRQERQVYRLALSTAVTRPSHCHCPGIALVMHAATLRWADTALARFGVIVHAHLLCLFCLLAVLMDGNQSFLCHLTPFTLI